MAVASVEEDVVVAHLDPAQLDDATEADISRSWPTGEGGIERGGDMERGGWAIVIIGAACRPFACISVAPDAAGRARRR